MTLEQLAELLRDLRRLVVQVDRKTDELLERLERRTYYQGQMIMADLTALTNQVAQNTSVEQSAITLLNGLSSLLAAAGTDPVKLNALQMQLSSSASALAAAITANTPSAPPATPAAPAPPVPAAPAAPTT
jgi:hypothetical protein